MKKIPVILLLLTFYGSTKVSVAQELNPQLVQQISYPVNYFTTNLAGELFVITAGNLLKKYNINGDSVGVYNDVRKFGKLSYLEAENTWKTILFYENFQTLVLLDKYLKYLGNINLREKDIFNVRAVANSYDNQIWVFDGREFKIKKLDDNGNVLMESVDFRQLFDEVPVPQWMGDSEDKLYLYDPERGFYIFDHYGAFKTLLPFKGWESVAAVKNGLIGFGHAVFYKYSPPVPVATEAALPAVLQQADKIEISNQNIFVLKKHQLSVYKF